MTHFGKATTITTDRQGCRASPERNRRVSIRLITIDESSHPLHRECHVVHRRMRRRPQQSRLLQLQPGSHLPRARGECIDKCARSAGVICMQMHRRRSAPSSPRPGAGCHSRCGRMDRARRSHFHLAPRVTRRFRDHRERCRKPRRDDSLLVGQRYASRAGRLSRPNARKADEPFNQ
jgi:hypothetical protein